MSSELEFNTNDRWNTFKDFARSTKVSYFFISYKGINRSNEKQNRPWPNLKSERKYRPNNAKDLDRGSNPCAFIAFDFCHRL